MPEIQLVAAYTFSSLNSQDNTMKCYCYKVHFIGEETRSRVLRDRVTSRVIHLGMREIGIRTPAVYDSKPCALSQLNAALRLSIKSSFLARALDHNPLSAHEYISSEVAGPPLFI